MAKRRHARCRVCRRHRDELGEELSLTGLCGDCGKARLLANIDAIHGHDGPGFLVWRRSIAASVGGLLVDDLERLAVTVGDVRLSELGSLLDGMAPGQ